MEENKQVLHSNSRITPYLTVKDINKSIDFYKNAFGFILSGEPWKDEEGNIVHAVMSYQEGIIFLRPESSQSKSKAPISLDIESSTWFCVNCDFNVDELFKQAVAAGVRVIYEPKDMPWARLFKVLDIDGYSWSFYQPNNT